MKLYFYTKNAHYTQSDTDKLILTSLVRCQADTVHDNDKPCADAVRVLRSPDGKPYLDGSALHVGVTHTDSLVVIAFSERPFGIDCESTARHVKNARRLAARYFSERENAYLFEDGAGDEDIQLRFLEIWVKKEAYVKFLGTGLRDLAGADTFALPGHYERIPYPDHILYTYDETSL